MKNKKDLIIDIMKCCRDAIYVSTITNGKNNLKFSKAYECLVNYPCILDEEYFKIIPDKIKNDYKFLIKLSKEQLKDRQEQDKLNPHIIDYPFNYQHFFLKLKGRATKALVVINNIYFSLIDEYYKIII